MPKENILVVDDEEDILELVRYNLAREGYQVTCVNSGEACIEACNTKTPDLVILDLMLPGIDGLDVCKALKAESKTKTLPVIMITAKGEEADVVTGLEIGAEDYIVKPFSPRILIARVKNALRRKKAEPLNEKSLIRIEGIVINPLRHEAFLQEQKLDLTATEFKLLHHLARHPGIVFTRAQLVDAVHGDDYPVTDRSVDVQIVGLRKKLMDSGSLIETVRGIGYKFKG